MELIAVMLVLILALVLRFALPFRFVKLFRYVAAVCLLLSILPVLIMAYAVNFNKQFFLWLPIHPYILMWIAFLMFSMFVVILLGIVGKKERSLQ